MWQNHTGIKPNENVSSFCTDIDELLIYRIPKWWPKSYSFVCMFISPLFLIFTSKFFCFFLYMLTSQKRAF